MKRVTSLKRSSLSLVICIQNASNTSQRTFLIQVFFNRVRFSFLFYLHFPPDFLILKTINFGIYLFFFAMQIPFKSWYKRLIHLLNVAKVRFIRKLDLVDSIPAAIRIPLWVLLLILGVIGLYSTDQWNDFDDYWCKDDREENLYQSLYLAYQYFFKKI